MRRRIIAVSAVVALTGLIALGQAAAPPSIPVQGILTDAAGLPLDGGVNAVVFSIYDGPSGGQALWTQNQSLVVEKGLFCTYLEPMDLSLFRDHGPLWLGVKVGSDQEMGRIPLGSTPFAAFAEYTPGPPSPEVSDEFSVQVGLVDCSSGCTQGLDLGTWKFCALTSYESKLYDNTGSDWSDSWRCNLILDPDGSWTLSATYDGGNSPQPVGYTRCGARCFN